MDDVVDLAGPVETLKDRHDRRDTTARGEEQHLGRQDSREGELALHRAEHDQRPERARAVDPLRDDAVFLAFHRQGQFVVGAGVVRAQRVRPPVPFAVDVEPDAQVLTRLVTAPPESGGDVEGGRVVGFLVDAVDAAAGLARRPQRVDEPEVVVGRERRREVLQNLEDARHHRRHPDRCTGFGRHGLPELDRDCVVMACSSPTGDGRSRQRRPRATSGRSRCVRVRGAQVR